MKQPSIVDRESGDFGELEKALEGRPPSQSKNQETV